MKARRIYVIGEAGLLEGLQAADFELTDHEVDAVVVGLDSQVDYAQLEKATLLIQGGAAFVGTNPDTNLPTERGLVPGNGALIAFLEASTGRKRQSSGSLKRLLWKPHLKKLV